MYEGFIDSLKSLFHIKECTYENFTDLVLALRSSPVASADATTPEFLSQNFALKIFFDACFVTQILSLKIGHMLRLELCLFYFRRHKTANTDQTIAFMEEWAVSISRQIRNLKYRNYLNGFVQDDSQMSCDKATI